MQAGPRIIAFSVALLCVGQAAADEPTVTAPSAESTVQKNIALKDGDAQTHDAQKLADAISNPSENLAPVEALIGAGADVNAVLPEGRNLLMVAVTNDNFAAVRLLLAAGAKPDLSTELFLASIEGDIKRVRAALDKGAKVDSEDYDGGTPLIFAVSRKRIDIVRLLIERGANVNHRNQAGWTALMYAANYMEPRSARLLLERGANLYLKNKSGKNALEELLTYDPESSHLFPYQKRDLKALRRLFRDEINARKTKNTP
jgi:ankyrin repeat protein